MALVILAAFAAAVNKTVTVIKSLTSQAWRTALTQVLVWVVGIVGIMLLCQAKLSSGMEVPGLSGVTFGSLDVFSQVLLGWIMGSTGSFAFDYVKAKDNTQSAVEPSLGGVSNAVEIAPPVTPLVTPPVTPP